MALIREIADVPLSSSTARAHWSGYVNELIASSEPGEQWTPYPWHRVERESDRDVVRFEQTGSGASRMTVELDAPGEAEDSPVAASLHASLRSDLECFCAGDGCTLRRAA
jgi:hypothetical protein